MVNLFTNSLILSLPFLSQFSDNGLVQFQSVAENEQYLLPAPLASGFPDNMNVALLAVFWDDADLTTGHGRLLYQVICDLFFFFSGKNKLKSETLCR